MASSTREATFKRCKAELCVGLSAKVLSGARQAKKGRDSGGSCSGGTLRRDRGWPDSGGFPSR